MRLIKATKPDKMRAPKTKNRLILEEFISSDCECCEVVDYELEHAFSVAGSLNRSIKTYRFSGIKAFTTAGRVYLIKLI